MYTIYFQISNSKNIAQPNGTQHTQRKQLEVLQACTDDGGAYQLIRTQSSSRWSSTSVSPAATSANASPTIPTTSTTAESNKTEDNDVRIEDDYDGLDDDCIDVSLLTDTTTTTSETTNHKSNGHVPTITVTETTAKARNKLKADNDVISLNGLEICEVSDTEIANVDYIDCNGIVVDADDISDHMIVNADDDDDDHDHEVYYHGKRVFDIKVQLADDYERPAPPPPPSSTVNGNNNINHNKNYNKNSHNNKNNSNNITHNNKNKTAQSNNKNHSLHTTPSIKLSNLMVSMHNNNTKNNKNNNHNSDKSS